MGGSGSSSGKGGGGRKASAASNAAIRSEVKTIATSTSSINQASTKIQRVLDRAPVGTELVFDEYYSRGKLMQSAYTKKNSSEWERAWRASGGKTYSTVRNSSEITASDIYNSVVSN